MLADEEYAIYYNPPGIDQSNGGLSQFPRVENINLGNFLMGGHTFLLVGQPGFNELRALIQLIGEPEADYFQAVVTWKDLMDVFETVGVDVSQLATRGDLE